MPPRDHGHHCDDPACALHAASLEEVVALAKQHMRQYGWALTGVGEGEDSPPFHYTTGLYKRFQHPELVVVGLPYEAGGVILNLVGETIKRGAHYGGGETLVGIATVPLRTRRVAVPTDGVGSPMMTKRIYGYDDFPYLQLLWPDRHGAWPDAPRFAAPAQQPLLPAA
jgi:hypothetical protein